MAAKKGSHKPPAKKGGKALPYIDAAYKPAAKKGGKAVAYVDAKPTKKK